MGRVVMMTQLTQHLDELVHRVRDLLLAHDEDHEADVDDIKGANQLLGNRVIYIPLLERDTGREGLGWRGCIK